MALAVSTLANDPAAASPLARHSAERLDSLSRWAGLMKCPSQVPKRIVMWHQQQHALVDPAECVVATCFPQQPPSLLLVRAAVCPCSTLLISTICI